MPITVIDIVELFRSEYTLYVNVGFLKNKICIDHIVYKIFSYAV